MGLCPYKKQRRYTETEAHREKMTTRRQRQILEWYIHKPRSSEGCQQISDARRSKAFSLQVQEGIWPCRYLDFRLLAFRTVKQ